MNNSEKYIDVISCDETITRYQSIAKQNLLYPLWAYNITLPVVMNGELNSLENVVYELIENKEKDPQHIATLTGLNVELVEFIISRLQQLELVTSRMQVTKLAQTKTSQQTKTQFIAATVYYDIANEVYLPKVVKNGMPVLYATKNKTKYDFHLGNSGESKEVKATRANFNKQTAPKLTPNDALNIIRRYRNILKTERLINSNTNDYYNVPISSIEIDNSPKSVYLHRQAFIPESRADIFVTNGFNGKINPDASRNFQRDFRGTRLYKRLKENADSRSLNNADILHVNQDVPMAKLKRAYQGLIDNEINSSSEHKAAMAYQAGFFKGIYSAIEHLLAKSALDSPAQDVAMHIHSTNAAVNGKNIINRVSKLGFTTNKLANYFFGIKRGTLNYLNYSDPSMSTMIALNVISANQALNHPLTALAREQPEFFERINVLKKLRNAASHGDIVTEIKDKQEVIQWYEWFEAVCKIFGDNISEVTTTNEGHIQKNSALRVSIEMDKYFNWHQKKLLPPEVKAAIDSALQKQLENNLSDAVNDCASALQKSFYYAAKSLDPVLDTSQLLAENSAAVVARKIGSCKSDNIPHSNKDSIERACYGVDSTLGANAMAFIYRAHIEDLKCCQNLKQFLPVTTKLWRLRGHNRRLTESDISSQDLSKLLINVFNVINDLTEHFCE